MRENAGTGWISVLILELRKVEGGGTKCERGMIPEGGYREERTEFEGGMRGSPGLRGKRWERTIERR